MPLKLKNPIRAALPLAFLALTASACAYIPFTEKTDAYELFTGHSTDLWCANGDDSWVMEDRADLAGPHFGLSVLCRFELREVPKDIAASAENLADLPVIAAGVELIVTQMAITPAIEAEYAPGHVSSWITVGEEKIELDSLPGGGDYLAVTAPQAEDAVLWVEDQGRAQGLDLRTGERIEPLAPMYDDIATYSEPLPGYVIDKFDIASATSKTWLRCHYEWAIAELSTWNPDLGWAPDGSVHMTVTTYWCGTIEEFTWNLNQEKALTVDGTAPVHWSDTLEDGWNRIEAVFTVPDDADEILIEFTPFGNITANGERYEYRDDPKVYEWLATF